MILFDGVSEFQNGCYVSSSRMGFILNVF